MLDLVSSASERAFGHVTRALLHAGAGTTTFYVAGSGAHGETRTRFGAGSNDRLDSHLPQCPTTRFHDNVEADAAALATFLRAIPPPLAIEVKAY